ncbi:uncharacterized protein N7483_005516 [Penicillium malachiteum]|uniref:uncharacterized protein n=1 Tax=Penicillium malachiteum TaxID=1324776 RepID=UPI0025477E8D|nr:uncharacterized protein N7483_005516 [Penicillium malachiteum]KAJ5731008.1 hypothetical protein N7483_005516 [Penicillium malachiteum]
MPAPVVEEVQADLHLDQQLEAVGKAFDALLLTLYRLTNRHNDLKNHTEDIFKQYTNVTRKLPLQDRPHAMEVQQGLLDQQKELCLGLVHNKSSIDEQSLNSMDVIKTLVAHQNVDETATRAIAAGVKGYKALLRSQDSHSQISSNSCMLIRGPDPSEFLEQDFTTIGAQGSLHCPFSKPQTPVGTEPKNGKDDGPKIRVDTCGHADLDPIKAEQEERRSSITPSAGTSSSRCPISRCPIRFLDKHSPEEIAEYVERHKHEIPRSHAICVKRYQKDPQNMRQLDAKYGGLINMISGLSVKHQAFLPTREENVGGNGHATEKSASTERVEKWAENVDLASDGPAPAEPPNEPQNKPEADDDNRESRFDRPLREVRLGESPSRPWGIHVPITEQTNASLPFSGSVPGPTSPEPRPVDPLDKSHPVESPDKAPADGPVKPAGRCPFGHGAPKPKATEPAPPEPHAATTGLAATAPDAEPLAPLWANMPPWATGKDAKDKDANAQADPKPMPSHVTFNGPVFFGYSAEQTVSLLQQFHDLNLGRPSS